MAYASLFLGSCGRGCASKPLMLSIPVFNNFLNIVQELIRSCSRTYFTKAVGSRRTGLKRPRFHTKIGRAEPLVGDCYTTMRSKINEVMQGRISGR